MRRMTKLKVNGTVNLIKTIQVRWMPYTPLREVKCNVERKINLITTRPIVRFWLVVSIFGGIMHKRTFNFT